VRRQSEAATALFLFPQRSQSPKPLRAAPYGVRRQSEAATALCMILPRSPNPKRRRTSFAAALQRFNGTSAVFARLAVLDQNSSSCENPAHS